MRTKLSGHLNKFVLGQGWVTDWDYMDETNSYRVYIQKPTIKEPNKNKTFSDLPLISKEDHINVFFKCEREENDSLPFEKYEQVNFNGIVKYYRRKNGTYDYGVYPLPCFRLEDELNNLFNALDYFSKSMSATERTSLVILEDVFKPKVSNLMKRMEESGNNLPTFYNNYQYYKRELEEWKGLLNKMSRCTRWVCSNRKLRRLHKISYNFASEIEEFDWQNPK